MAGKQNDAASTREQEQRNARDAARPAGATSGGMGIGAGPAPDADIAVARGVRPGGISTPPVSPATGEDGGDPVPASGIAGAVNSAAATPASGEAEVMRKRLAATPVLRTVASPINAERVSVGPRDKLPKPSKAAKSESGRKVRLHGALDTTRVEGGKEDGEPVATTLQPGIYDASAFSAAEYELGLRAGVLFELTEDEQTRYEEAEAQRADAEKAAAKAAEK